MVEKSFVNLARAQRVDQPELQQIAEATPRDLLAQLVEEVLVGTDGGPAVLWGFEQLAAGGTVEFSRGAAICGFRVDGELRRGMVLAGGPASRSFPCASLDDGTYGAYVRLVFRETRVRNRRHWNAAALPPEEVTVLQATRISEDWDFTLERGNPGADWLKVGTYTVAGGSATPSLSGDYRAQKFFDSYRSNRRIEDSDWGSDDDRDEAASEPNAASAVKGFRRWALMVMRQLQDVVDVDFFGSDPKGGTEAGVDARSLSQLNAEKLNRTGLQTFAGVLGPDADQTRDLATSGTRWRDLFARTVDFAGNLVSAGTGVVFLSLSAAAALTENRSVVSNTPNGGPGANTAELLVRAGTTGLGRVVVRAAEVLLDPGTRVDVDNRRIRFTNAGTGSLEANPAATVGLTNELNAKCFAKVIAVVSPDGVGGFTVESDSMNLTSVAWQGGTSSLRLSFAAPMGTTTYSVSGSWHDGGGSNPHRFLKTITKDQAFVDVQWVTDGGSVVNLSTDSNGGHMCVEVTGIQ